jgi:Zn-dependent protease
MKLEYVNYVFLAIVFLFAISFHESAHAWMANRCGDPTARMLGRISLNPLKHIDPFGTVILPLIAIYYHIPVLGWAKPTPVDPRNFRHQVRDDILTAVVGPISNFLVAGGALVFLIAIGLTSHLGAGIINVIPLVFPGRLDVLANQTNSLLMPVSLLAYELMLINIVLAVFNLIPVPPLDGSHVLRHFLPDPVRKAYDTVGWIGLIALIYLAPGFIGRLIWPVVGIFNSMLLSVIRTR